MLWESLIHLVRGTPNNLRVRACRTHHLLDLLLYATVTFSSNQCSKLNQPHPHVDQLYQGQKWSIDVVVKVVPIRKIREKSEVVGYDRGRADNRSTIHHVSESEVAGSCR